MIPRRSILALPLLAAGCGNRDPEIPLPATPIGFRHLLPLRLNVAEVVLAETSPPLLPNDLGAGMALPPLAALRQLGQERLVAMGGNGRATFTPTQASLLAEPGGVACLLACRLDVNGEAGAGYIEASARGNVTLPDRVSPATRQRAAEAALRQALDRLNVEFEFQVRRTLRGWLASTATAAPPPPGVEREDLPRG